jgi:acetyl esterase/lipase
MTMLRVLRRIVPALAGLALLVSATGCDWPEGTRYVDKVFDTYTTTADVTYRTTTDFQGNTVDLKLDIYQPAGDTASQRPAIMWMFGGGWVAGDKSMMTPVAQDAALRGYVGVSIQYRIRPGATGNSLIAAIFDAYDDAVAAVQWLKDHAAEYKIDPRAIVSGGYSAGAVNTMHLLYRPEAGQSPVAGGVSVAGGSGFQAEAGDPPVLMHHGDADQIASYPNAQTLCDNAKAAGDVCQFITYPGVDHLVYFSQQAAIEDSTAKFVFEQVLWPLGYRVEHIG